MYVVFTPFRFKWWPLFIWKQITAPSLYQPFKGLDTFLQGEHSRQGTNCHEEESKRTGQNTTSLSWIHNQISLLNQITIYVIKCFLENWGNLKHYMYLEFRLSQAAFPAYGTQPSENTGFFLSPLDDTKYLKAAEQGGVKVSKVENCLTSKSLLRNGVRDIAKSIISTGLQLTWCAGGLKWRVLPPLYFPFPGWKRGTCWIAFSWAAGA